ncbi:MAG TPA: nuclear transport factor 2 family protein [Thermoanaerobaculia bacterium]|nr:nuclear transport factor 2 family protein [Thermoanaerobaculia bacterium]
MKRAFAALLVVAAACATVPRDPVAAVRAREREWLDIYERRDPAAMEEILADEFTITFGDGSVQTKADVVASMRRGTKGPHFYTEDVTARVRPGIVVLSGRVKSDRSDDRYTDTYVFERGKWRVLASHLSSVRSRDDAEVRAAMQGFMDALNALDADRIASYFADNITAFFPTAQGDRVNGKAAVVEIFRTYVAATSKPTNLVPEDLQVTMSGDLALVTFNIRNPAVTSRRTFVFRRSGGRWLITHLHASNFRP